MAERNFVTIDNECQVLYQKNSCCCTSFFIFSIENSIIQIIINEVDIHFQNCEKNCIAEEGYVLRFSCRTGYVKSQTAGAFIHERMVRYAL